MDDYLKKVADQRKRDAERYRQHDSDLCMLCHAYGADKRSLVMSALVDMSEVISEMIDLHDVGLDYFKIGYYLRICKACRGELMGKLDEWAIACRKRRSISKTHDGYPDDWFDDDVIDKPKHPVQMNGITVYLTDYDFMIWKSRQPKEVMSEDMARDDDSDSNRAADSGGDILPVEE